MKRYFKNVASKLNSLKTFLTDFLHSENFLLAIAKTFLAMPCRCCKYVTHVTLPKFREAANWDRLEWGDLLANF